MRDEETIHTSKDFIELRSLKLSILEGDDRGKVATIKKRLFSVGKAKSCDLTLSDPAVSSRHLQIELNAKGARLRDLESKNGTFVGKLRVIDACITSAVRLQLGRTLILLEPTQDAVKLSLSDQQRFGDLVSGSTAMRELFAKLSEVAKHDTSVLLEGETGCGKSALARAIHDASGRRDKPFVVLDCGTLPMDLAERELFGHVKGAFTDARQDSPGVFEQADGGTLFIDEIGDLPLALQPKLLRALQENEIQRLGATKPTKVNIRYLFATNRDLGKEINRGNFRDDLFYRISVVHLRVPALRERPEDIPALASELLLQRAGRLELALDAEQTKNIIDSNLQKLKNYTWPGNVRELGNRMEALAIKLNASGLLEQSVDVTSDSLGDRSLEVFFKTLSRSSLSLREAKQRITARFERDYLRGLLNKSGGNVSEAARMAEMDRRNLQRLLKKYNL